MNFPPIASIENLKKNRKISKVRVFFYFRAINLNKNRATTSMASRSPISRKDDSSKANLKSHVSVPKGFPAELLKPKTNQPIKSIHKVWNFVQLGKPTDSNNSKKGTSQPSIATIDAARDLAHQKNFTSLRTTATTSSVRDKTPPPNLGNSKSNPTFQSQARPSASEYSSVQPGNYRPSHDSQSNF